MRILPALLLLALISGSSATAQEAPLPHERPVAAEPVAATPVASGAPDAATPKTVDGALVPPLPRARPAVKPTVAAAAKQTVPAKTGVVLAALAEAVPPTPPRIYQGACPAVLMGLVQAQTLPPISEGNCGERSPLSITGVLANGRMVTLSSAATLNCAMATTLPDWVAAIDGYIWARENTHIASLITGTSYMCRKRNNGTSGDTSEHGFANALDVVGFKLEDGRTVTLPGGWPEALSAEGRILRFAHNAGCSRFSTTLGPEANALHADHLHVDLGCHGKTCTARLCE